MNIKTLYEAVSGPLDFEAYKDVLELIRKKNGNVYTDEDIKLLKIAYDSRDVIVFRTRMDEIVKRVYESLENWIAVTDNDFIKKCLSVHIHDAFRARTIRDMQEAVLVGNDPKMFIKRHATKSDLNEASLKVLSIIEKVDTKFVENSYNHVYSEVYAISKEEVVLSNDNISVTLPPEIANLTVNVKGTDFKKLVSDFVAEDLFPLIPNSGQFILNNGEEISFVDYISRFVLSPAFEECNYDCRILVATTTRANNGTVKIQKRVHEYANEQTDLSFEPKPIVLEENNKARRGN